MTALPIKGNKTVCTIEKVAVCQHPTAWAVLTANCKNEFIHRRHTSTKRNQTFRCLSISSLLSVSNNWSVICQTKSPLTTQYISNHSVASFFLTVFQWTSNESCSSPFRYTVSEPRMTVVSIRPNRRGIWYAWRLRMRSEILDARRSLKRKASVWLAL